MQPKSPIKTTFCLSKLFYCWTVPLLWLGTRRELEQDDVHEVLDSDTAENLGSELNAFWKNELSSGHPSLCKALSRLFGFRILCNVFVILIQQTVIRLSIPILLGLLIRYMDGLYTDSEGYTLAALFVGLSLLSNVLFNRCSFSIKHSGMKMRVALTAFVYQKVLRLSQSSVSQTGIGKLTNIISNDMNRFDQGVEYWAFLLVGPVQLVLVSCILWHYTGIACLSGAGVICLLLLTQGVIGRYFGKLRSTIATKTDTRVRRVNELIENILLIKVSAWEEAYTEIVSNARREEVKPIKKRSKLDALNLAIFEISTKLSVLSIFLTLVLMNQPLTPELVFVTLATLNTIYESSGICIPLAISSISEVMVSIRRIQTLLLLDEKSTNLSTTFTKCPFMGIKTTEFSASWLPNTNNLKLSSISLEARMGQLIGITGHVGSGKSSILHAIMGELELTSGSILTRGRVAYAPQEPWIFSASIQENITFGLPRDQAWYETVIHACALHTDLHSLPFGDQTMVGDKGIMLSGGQKARISLARAVYSKADIYLLDDPLSAVDVKVALHLMEECITGCLKEKCVILVTHQTRFLSGATEVIEIKNGTIAKRGSFQEVFRTNETNEGDNFVDPLNDNEMVDPKSDTNPLHSLSTGATIQQVSQETKSTGQIRWETCWEYLRAGNSLLGIVIMVFVCVLAQVGLNASDFWLKEWTDHEAQILHEKLEPVKIVQLQSNFTTVSYNDASLDVKNQLNNLLIYGIIVSGAFVAVLLRAFTVYCGLVDSSIALHKRLLTSVLRAPMSFFESNSVGRILNRFSNDIGKLDEYVPTEIFVTIGAGSEMLGSMFLIVFLGYELILPTILQLVAICFLAKAYVRPASVLKRLEGIARSPVLSQMGITLSGLPLIRSFGTQTFFTNRFISHLNTHTSTYYACIVTSQWLRFTLELVSNFYTCILLLYFLFTSHSSSAFGLALSSAMTLTLCFSVTLSCAAESINQLISAERVIEYTHLPPEAPLRLAAKVSPDWPKSGRIQMNQLVVQHKNGPKVLKGVTLDIRAGEKVGIIGRTGAGKSSLISTLFRTVELTEGQLLIDGLDISQIGLHDLRPKISIIPQNPVLLQGTLRKNLDPTNKYEDADLWVALETAELSTRIKSNSEAGLDSEVSEAGGNLSQGERQLICLARTILSGNKIIVLDEATANIDARTDSIIQEAIRKKFKDATVLTVAHRLETVMDNDKILVLDAGQVKEFGAPMDLLETEGSYLRSLVQRTGEETAPKLWNIAKLARQSKCTQPAQINDL